MVKSLLSRFSKLVFLLAGILLISGFLARTVRATTVSDDFNRANGGLGANWEVSNGNSAFNIYSNAVGVPVAASGRGEDWIGSAILGDQFSQATLLRNLAADEQWYVGVRVQPNASGRSISGYFGGAVTSLYRIYFFNNNSSGTLLASSSQTPAANDVVRFEARG